MKHLSFPEIEQYRHAIKSVRERSAFHEIPVPKIVFCGTVKLHGTNAGVVMDLMTGEIWAQSRSHCITPESDNAGFARYVADNMDTFRIMLEDAQEHVGHPSTTHVAIFGEWGGQGIMKGVAINQLPKMFVVFGIKAIEKPDENVGTWFTSEEIDEVVQEVYGVQRIFSIYRFQTYTVEVDFMAPEIAQNEFVNITNAVEAECPVGKAFGVSGIGEGVVWHAVHTLADIRIDDLVFKVKGAKHSDSKVKTTAAVDVEKINNIRELASSFVTDHRLEKMVEKLQQDSVPMEPQSIPVFLKLVGQDIVKEETDTIEASGFTHKDVMPVVNRLARDWFIKLVNKV